MKNCLLITLILAALVFASCNKNNGVSPYTLSGTWHVVSDSTYSSGIGPFGPPTSHTYIGTSSDYFKFSGNNSLSIKEDSIRIGTGTYTVSKDTLKFSYRNLIYYSQIATNASESFFVATSGKTMQLTSFLVSPGGIFSEKIILSH